MLQEAVDEYIASLSSKEDERGRSNHNTTAAYRNDLNQLCTYLKQQEIDNWLQVTREHVTGYILEMRESQAYRPTTVARKIAAFKSFFRYASGTTRPRYVTYAVYNRYARTELVSLNMADFDASRATVVCPGRNGQNRRERVLPLPAIAVEAVQQYIQAARPRLMLRHPEEEALFLNHHGERLTRQGFWLIIKGYARQAGITTITPHMLRHSFAMLMLKGGMELRSVQELLGHAHISTTQVYSQLVRTKTTTTIK